MVAPNDMDDLCKLYEKAGGINEVEQDQIISAPRGHAFTVLSAKSRSSFKIEVPDALVEMFEMQHYDTHYFEGTDGAENWEDFVGERPKMKLYWQALMIAVDFLAISSLPTKSLMF